MLSDIFFYGKKCLNMTTDEGNQSTERERIKLWEGRSSRAGRRMRPGSPSKKMEKALLPFIRSNGNKKE